MQIQYFPTDCEEQFEYRSSRSRHLCAFPSSLHGLVFGMGLFGPHRILWFHRLGDALP